MYKKTPDNINLQDIILDLFSELYLFHDVNSLATFSIVNTPRENSTEVTDTVSLNKTSKLDRIRQQRQDSTQHWSTFVFSSILQMASFRELASNGIKLGQDRKNKNQPERGIFRRNQKKTFSWDDLKNVVVINPVFIHLDGTRKDAELNFEEGYSRRQALNGIISYTAGLHGIGAQVLDVYDLKAENASVFNDIIAAEKWMSSQFSADEFPMHSYDDASIARFVENYGTPYLMTVGAVSAQSRNPGLISRFFGKASSLFFVIIINVETGEKQLLNADYFNYYLDDSFLKSQLYDAFAKLSKNNK